MRIFVFKHTETMNHFESRIFVKKNINCRRKQLNNSVEYKWEIFGVFLLNENKNIGRFSNLY